MPNRPLTAVAALATLHTMIIIVNEHSQVELFAQLAQELNITTEHIRHTIG